MELFRLFGSIFIDNDEANKSIQDTDKKAKDLAAKFADGIKKAGLWTAGLTAAAGALAVSIGTKAFNSTEQFNKALNGLQASTGAGAEKMSGMRDAMLDIYNNNFGQSFEDVGAAMQNISQQTKQNGNELANTTKNALAVRDAFGIEVSESIRSANQLTKNFGLSSTDAYNLIAQGAQKGLNANENLADSINEYSVHFSQLGLGANEMFNMFSNGAESGVFDIDKLGDAIKEFGIRSKDGSKGTTEAFETLGLDARKISSDFAAGGEKGKAAFELVTSKLNAMKDPLTQNATGVALFGTMYEDIGAKGVAALTSTKGGIDQNINALGKINEVKYDTVTEAFAGIGRQLETGILIPLGEKILPILNDFGTWIQDNMPTIIEKFNGIVDSVFDFTNGAINLMKALTPLFAGIVGGAAVFGIYSLAMNASVIATAIWITVTGIATGVGTAFAAVLAFITSPIGLVVIAIGALIAIGVLLYQNWDVIKAKAIEIFDAIKTWIDEKITAMKEAFTNAITNFKEAGSNVFNAVWDGLKEIWTKVSTWVSEIVTAIKDLFINAATFYLEAGKTVFTAIWNGLKEIWTNLSTWVSEIVTAIKDYFTNAATKFLEAGKKVFDSIWNGLKEVWLKISTWVSEKVTAIKDVFTNSVEGFKKAGKDIFNGVWDGIKDIWNSISNWVSEKVSWLVDKLSFWKSSQSTMSSGGTFNGVPIKARAIGGSINPGETYLVGEKGPELFTSNQSGSIIPNHKLATAGTGINITITGNTIMGDADADRFGDLIVRRLKSLGVT